MTDSATRYSRQTRLPEWGESAQRRIAEARVLIVGVGGLGSPVALYLAAAGVGTLGLVDDDVVDVSNLQRQMLFSDADVSRRKVPAAAEELRRKNPELRVIEHDERLVAANALEIGSGYDLVIDGSDNFGTKFLLNDLCLKRGIPLIYGAVNAFEGQVALFDGTRGPCYRCLIPASPRARIRSCAETGVLGALVGMIGSMQAMIALQRLASKGDADHPLNPVSGALQWIDVRGAWATRTISVKKRRDCPSCSRPRELLELADLAEGACESIPVIRATQLAARLADVNLLDVREAEEREEGFIPGSLHWPLSRLQKGEFPHVNDCAAEWVLYCRAGIRSKTAALILREAGFERVTSLEGGFEAWPPG